MSKCRLVLTSCFLLLLVASRSYAHSIDSLLNLLSAPYKFGMSYSADTLRFNTLIALSDSYINSKNENLAIKYAEEALATARRVGYKKGAIIAINYIGYSYARQTDHDKAIAFYMMGIKISNEINDRNSKAGFLNDIGAIYFQRKNFGNAKNMFRLALEEYKVSGNNKRARLTTLGNLGAVLATEGNYEESRKTFLIAIAFSERYGLKQDITAWYHNIGRTYLEQKKYHLALENCLKALTFPRTNNNLADFASAESDIANIYAEMGNYSKAAEFMELAIKTSKQTKDKILLSTLYSSMAEFYSKTSDYKKAFEYTRLNFSLTDSIFGEKAEQRIAEMNAKFEAEKKDHKITQLKKDKERDLKEIASQKQYRKITLVASCIVVGLLLLLGGFILRSFKYQQKGKLDKIEKGKIKAELDLLKTQIGPHAMFNFLNTIYIQIDENKENTREMIMKFSELLRFQLYEFNHDFIAIEKEIYYLKKVVEIHEIRKSKRCRIEFNIDEQVKNFNIAPLLLIPLVENAFKYVTNDKDSENFIHLSLLKQNDGIEFTVKNTMKEEGFDKSKANSGIGLANLRSRLNLVYPKKHHLTVTQDNSVFTAKLELNV